MRTVSISIGWIDWISNQSNNYRNTHRKMHRVADWESVSRNEIKFNIELYDLSRFFYSLYTAFRGR